MLEEKLTVREALNDPTTANFSRMPVYSESTDNVTGKVIRVDLFEAEKGWQRGFTDC